LERRGDWLPVLMGGDRVGEVGMQAAALQPACFTDREEPLDGAVAVLGLGAVTGLAPQNTVAQSALRGVIRCRDAGDPGERPERVVALQEPRAEPGGLRVAAAGALLEQFAQLLAVGREIDRKRGCQFFRVS
jgi:hypothetical protein